MVIVMKHESENRERPWVRVHTAGNRFEADLLGHALEQESIPFRLRLYEETAYDGLFVPQQGWGALFVPEGDEEKARDVIKRVMETVPLQPRLASGGSKDEQEEEGEDESG
jgi:hypothetical protein